MQKKYRWLLRLLPWVVGMAWVTNELEKKQPRKFSLRRVLILLVLFGGAIISLFSAYVVWHYGDEFTGKINGCAVVFGAAVWKDDQPSHALNDRVQSAITLYKRHQVDCIVFSGGASKFGAHEVAVMAKLADEAGVPETDWRFDYDGNNTLATLLNLPSRTDYVFVSNDFHLARINLMAQRLGFENYHLQAAPYLKGRYGKDSYYFAREVFGTMLVWIKLH